MLYGQGDGEDRTATGVVLGSDGTTMHLDDGLDEEQTDARVVVAHHGIEDGLLATLGDTHAIIRDTDRAGGRGFIDKHLDATVGG